MRQLEICHFISKNLTFFQEKIENKLTSAKKKFESCLVEEDHNIKLSEEGTLFADEIIVNLLF